MPLRNRIFVTAMGVNLADENGFCGERIRAWHEEQARGGAALIVMGVVGVGWPIGANIPRQVGISDDRFIPGLRAVAETVHAHGAKIAAQLHFGGLSAMEDILAGRPVWGPSVPEMKENDVIEGFLDSELAETALSKIVSVSYKVMSAEDIDVLVKMYVDAARRARQAGIDGVEIHAAHGYILSSFLSPVTNQRTDEYGGSLANRARLLLTVLRAVREAVGPDYPMWCKLDSQEFGQPNGISLDDACEVAWLVQEAGADAITVSAYHDTSRAVLHSASHTPQQPGLLLDNAAAIKAAVSIPVITAGRIEPEVGDSRIAAGHCDFIAMGRKLLADPHLPRKLTEGRAEDVRPCVYCYTCISETYLCRSVKCAVNPELAFERELRIEPTRDIKHIAVIGGGPAGMEAARRLALKGHDVTLIEQSDHLGGALQAAALTYAPNLRLLEWLKREIRESVDVLLNTSASVELLRELAVDEVVVATGAVWTLPPLQQPAGKPIVISGGDAVGLGLADYFSQQSHPVTVADESPKLGAGMACVRRWRVLSELKDRGVTLMPNTRVSEVDPHKVTYLDAHARADLTLANALEAAGFKVHRAGDCTGVGYIVGAMRSAALAAQAI